MTNSTKHKNTKDNSDKKENIQENIQDNSKDNSKNASNRKENPKQKLNVTDFWHDKKNKDLLFYLVVGIFMLELIIAVAAFFYGIVNSIPGENGLPPRFQFPVLAYAISAVVAPAVFLLIIHLLGIGLFRSLKRSPVEDAAWRQNLPERLRKIYTIIHGAPTALLLVGIVALGIALFYIDGAMQALLRLGSALEGYLLWIIGGILLVWCITYIIRIWFKYRIKRLESEYQYRREVFESSGIIIVDKGCMQLPASANEVNIPQMIGGGQSALIEISANNLEQDDDKDSATQENKLEHIVETIEVVDIADIKDAEQDSKIVKDEHVENVENVKNAKDAEIINKDAKAAKADINKSTKNATDIIDDATIVDTTNIIDGATMPESDNSKLK